MNLGGRPPVLACVAILSIVTLATSCMAPVTGRAHDFSSRAPSIQVVALDNVTDRVTHDDSVAVWVREGVFAELKQRESTYTVRIVDPADPEGLKADAFLRMGIDNRWFVGLRDEAAIKKDGSFGVYAWIEDANAVQLWDGRVEVPKEMVSREGIRRRVGEFMASRFPFRK